MSRQPGVGSSGRPGRAATALVFILVTVLLAACAAAGSAPSAAPAGAGPAMRGTADQAAGAGGGESGDEAAEGAGGQGAAPGSGYEPGGEPMAQLAERRVVKTGEVTLEVGNVAEALGRVRAVAAELGGYVGGSQAGTLEDSASLTVRVPADRFDDALAQLHELDG
ncbi:MAG TPA: DUF4349 domain-containing protein, partial [Candidatus Limnocylindria bacterium]|nr:DUF4349 domain-containing protein [Candidatus Limnocylindria bacterium]